MQPGTHHVPTLQLATGLEVSAQGYGAMSLTDVYGPVDDDQALATVTHAVDAGATFVDTANLYGLGRSERIISSLLRHRRSDVQLASKFGIVPGEGIGKRSINGRPEYVKEQIDLSLQRLKTDHVDLYYQHRVDPAVPIEETVGAMAELVSDGKVLHLGLSEPTGDEIRRAAAVHPIAAIQSEWSIFSRDVETHVIPAALEVGAGFVPYSPLGRGFFADPFDANQLLAEDGRHNFPRFTPAALTANEPLRLIIVGIARAVDATPAQVALAWLQHKAAQLGITSAPIPGTRYGHRIDENLAALDLTLEEEQLATLDSLSARVVGNRSAELAWVSGGREGLLSEQ